MRKSKFSPEQILQALRQAEAGTVVGDICRKRGCDLRCHRHG
ncbi:MAG: transposase [Gemmatimonadaceae bacterium]|nr:transposase [Gemmatimonadaceae bacterium]